MGNKKIKGPYFKKKLEKVWEIQKHTFGGRLSTQNWVKSKTIIQKHQSSLKKFRKKYSSIQNDCVRIQNSNWIYLDANLSMSQNKLFSYLTTVI